MQIIIYIIILSLVVIGYLLWGVYKVLRIDAHRYRNQWKALASQPAPEGAIRLVALGDSVFQSVGATQRELGVVGRIATYLEEQTGRSVHVANLCRSGATAKEIVDEQLSLVDPVQADIIVVAAGANDSIKRSDPDIFKEAIEQIAATLPPEKTIMADVALVKRRKIYQDLLAAARKQHKIPNADIAKAFQYAPRWQRLSARDFFHPSDHGHQVWFEAFRPALDDLISRQKLAK